MVGLVWSPSHPDQKSRLPDLMAGEAAVVPDLVCLPQPQRPTKEAEPHLEGPEELGGTEHL